MAEDVSGDAGRNPSSGEVAFFGPPEPFPLLPGEVEAETFRWVYRFLQARECPHPLTSELARTVADHIASLVYEGQHGEVESTAVFEEALARAVELAELWAERGLEVGGVSVEHRVIARSPRSEVWAIPRLQDICGPLYPLRWADCELYALFESHGAGVLAAQFAAAHLPHNLADHPRLADDPPTALRDAFRLTDRHFLRRAALLQERTDGCSAVCALRKADTLHVAWLGACGAALLAEGGSRPLTQAHTLQAQEEQKAILNVGGFLEQDPMGIWRIQDGPPLSRALGFLEHKPLISGEPDIVTLSLKDEHALILKSESLMPGDSSPETLMLVPLSEYGKTHLDSIQDLLMGTGSKMPPRNDGIVDGLEPEHYPVNGNSDHNKEDNGFAEVHNEEKIVKDVDAKKTENIPTEIIENGIDIEKANIKEINNLFANHSEGKNNDFKEQFIENEPKDTESKKKDKDRRDTPSFAKIKTITNKTTTNLKSQTEVKKLPISRAKVNTPKISNYETKSNNRNGVTTKSQNSLLNSKEQTTKITNSGTTAIDKQHPKKITSRTSLVKNNQTKANPEKKVEPKVNSSTSRSRTITIKVPGNSSDVKGTRKITVAANGDDVKNVCAAMLASLPPEMCKEMERKGSVTATMILNKHQTGSPTVRRKSLSSLPGQTSAATTQRKSSLPSQKSKPENILSPSAISKNKKIDVTQDKTRKESELLKSSDQGKTKPKLNGKPPSSTTTKTPTNGTPKTDAKAKSIAKPPSKSAFKANLIAAKSKINVVNTK